MKTGGICIALIKSYRATTRCQKRATQLPGLTLQKPDWSLLRLSELFAHRRLEHVVWSTHGSRLFRECVCDLHMSWLSILPSASGCGVFYSSVTKQQAHKSDKPLTARPPRAPTTRRLASRTNRCLRRFRFQQVAIAATLAHHHEWQSRRYSTRVFADKLYNEPQTHPAICVTTSAIP